MRWSMVRLQQLWLPPLLLLALAFAACGGGGEKKTTSEPVATPTPQSIQPIIVSSDLAVGPNRFVVALVDQRQNTDIRGAQVRFRFFKLAKEGSEAILKGEMDASTVTVEKSYSHVHEDGTRESHGAGEVGFYAASVSFDLPGQWGVEINGTLNGQPLPTLSPAFIVQERSRTVAVGQPAPRSVQSTLRDVNDISEVSTAHQPNPDMYKMTIAEAVTSGKATVIVFATPGFCMSRICGPAAGVVDQLYERHKGQVNFIHVEPYDLKRARSGQGLKVLPWIEQEWGLPTEPWVFVVDRDGNIADKFEGVVTFREVETALVGVLVPT